MLLVGLVCCQLTLGYAQHDAAEHHEDHGGSACVVGVFSSADPAPPATPVVDAAPLAERTATPPPVAAPDLPRVASGTSSRGPPSSRV